MFHKYVDSYFTIFCGPHKLLPPFTAATAASFSRVLVGESVHTPTINTLIHTTWLMSQQFEYPPNVCLWTVGGSQITITTTLTTTTTDDDNNRIYALFLFNV